jgi:hypothetical protein
MFQESIPTEAVFLFIGVHFYQLFVSIINMLGGTSVLLKRRLEYTVLIRFKEID